MESLRAARLIGIRTLMVLLSAIGAAIGALALFLEKHSPADMLRDLRSRSVLWPWLTHSTKLVIGTLAYNVFVLVAVQPILRKWFPPLKPWEHVQGVFAGSTRTTYEELVPVVATALWIGGNALVITLLNRRLQVDRNVE